MAKTTALLLSALVLFVGLSPWRSEAGHPPKDPPNIVLILADDMGYADLSCYGHPSQERGAIDGLARDGMRFTDMYSAATFCTPSRAALLTGRHPFRSGMIGPTAVSLPSHRIGLPLEETTLAEVLRDQGYRTGMVGKWHQGINRATPTDGYYLPHRQGFDFVGTMLPFSLVMRCDDSKQHFPRPSRADCFVYHNGTIVQQPIQLRQLSSAMLHDAQAFLHDTQRMGGTGGGGGGGTGGAGGAGGAGGGGGGGGAGDGASNRRQPFFLFYSLPQVHSPMFSQDGFKGKSRRGPYGDQILEVDWAVGKLLDTLDELGIRNNTLVLFTSDHGPQKELGLEGGSAGLFKGGKGSFYEGGLRVPFIASWPQVIPGGSLNHNVLSLMDLLPTMHSLTNSAPDASIQLDGRSFAHQLYDPNPESSNEDNRFLPFFWDRHLFAARYGPYKLHFRTTQVATEDVVNRRLVNGVLPGNDWYVSVQSDQSQVQTPPVLYNVEQDPGENHPLNLRDFAGVYEEIKQELVRYMKTVPEELPEPLLTYANRDRSVLPCCNPPYCVCFNDLWSSSVCPA